MNRVQVSQASGGEVDTGTPDSSGEDVHSYALKVLDALGLDGVAAAITFCDDPFIRDLNRRFRGKDEPTDVLSFCQCDDDSDWAGDAADPDDGEKTGHSERHIGDIILSTETLRANAAYFGVPVGEELHRLIVHGLMHLAGHDHESNDPSCPMLVRQEEILKSLAEATKR